MKSKRGLLISAQLSDSGVISIIMDDIIKNDTNASSWNVDCFVTSQEYDEQKFDDLDFNEKELADFGYYILSRLYAFKQRNEI
jgi:hypothetical protein